jgi:hypothetical protein
MNSKRTVLIVSLLLLTAAVIFPAPNAAAQSPVNAEARVQYFYQSLLPYGNWIWHAQYGWCWYPYNMPVDWQPYSDGYWSYTDYGWTWASDYPWGWACFHYGRWFYDDNYGWLWWPDTQWAPSWVVWRTGGDWIGWAPCPPEAAWVAGSGLIISGDIDFFFPFRAFCFVNRRHFLDHDLRHRLEMHARNVTIFNETTVSRDNLRSEGKRIVNSLPVQKLLEEDLGHPVPRYRLAEADSPKRLMQPPSGVITRGPGMQLSPEIQNRHAFEMRALQDLHASRQRMLEEQQNREIKSAPDNAARRQLMQRHQIERQAQQQQMDQERRVIQNWQGREKQIFTAPGAPPQRRFNLPVKQERGEDKEQSGGEGRKRSE